MSTRKSELHDAITEALEEDFPRAGQSYRGSVADRILADPRVLPLIEGVGSEERVACEGCGKDVTEDEAANRWADGVWTCAECPLCVCGHPESEHAPEYHPVERNICRVGGVDEDDIGWRCSCVEFRPTVASNLPRGVIGVLTAFRDSWYRHDDPAIPISEVTEQLAALLRAGPRGEPVAWMVGTRMTFSRNDADYQSRELGGAAIVPLYRSAGPTEAKEPGGGASEEPTE